LGEGAARGIKGVPVDIDVDKDEDEDTAGDPEVDPGRDPERACAGREMAAMEGSVGRKGRNWCGVAIEVRGGP
jgi:hypothetical protein